MQDDEVDADVDEPFATPIGKLAGGSERGTPFFSPEFFSSSRPAINPSSPTVPRAAFTFAAVRADESSDESAPAVEGSDDSAPEEVTARGLHDTTEQVREVEQSQCWISAGQKFILSSSCNSENKRAKDSCICLALHAVAVAQWTCPYLAGFNVIFSGLTIA